MRLWNETFIYLNKYAVNSRKLKKFEIQNRELNLLKINVIRTMPFEYISKDISIYLNNSLSMETTYFYTDYDNSLMSYSNKREDSTVFWIDWRLYAEKMSPIEVLNWFKERLNQVEGHQPIIVNNWPTSWDLNESPFALSTSSRRWYVELNYLLLQLVESHPRLVLCDLDYLVGSYGHTAYDERNDRVSSYPFSNRFTLELARYFGLTLLPALLQPKLKLLILDLDYTLYRGVLGEDRLEGIVFEESHLALQQLLMKLKENGILLAISSKNELADVEQLIQQHPDFLLNVDDFVFIEANWDEKEKNIRSIIERVNIDPSAALFVDDNIVELSKVQAAIPKLHLLLADETGEETWHRIRNYPGIYSLTKDDTAQKRREDIVANTKREVLQAQNIDNPYAYLNSLQMEIHVYRNEQEHLQRIVDLSNKTNQFNTNLQRYTEVEVQERFTDSNYDFYTVTLSDFLSDSGIIGVFGMKHEEQRLIVDEILFSCRALGRQVENFSLLTILQQYEEVESVEILSQKSDRNGPALKWVDTVTKVQQKASIIRQLQQQLEGYEVEVTYHE